MTEQAARNLANAMPGDLHVHGLSQIPVCVQSRLDSKAAPVDQAALSLARPAFSGEWRRHLACTD
jgi:hypothetical protein